MKVDYTPEEAIQQIKDRQYALRFAPKLGEAPRYTGRILAVGIAYDREKKKHRCKIEVLRPVSFLLETVDEETVTIENNTRSK